MPEGEEPTLDDVINEIAALFAAAYKRRARIRLVHTPKPVASTEDVDNMGETRVHELTLTRLRKESPRS